jgi:hypothetical protein
MLPALSEDLRFCPEAADIVRMQPVLSETGGIVRMPALWSGFCVNKGFSFPLSCFGIERRHFSVKKRSFIIQGKDIISAVRPAYLQLNVFDASVFSGCQIQPGTCAGIR